MFCFVPTDRVKTQCPKTCPREGTAEATSYRSEFKTIRYLRVFSVGQNANYGGRPEPVEEGENRVSLPGPATSVFGGPPRAGTRLLLFGSPCLRGAGPRRIVHEDQEQTVVTPGDPKW